MNERRQDFELLQRFTRGGEQSAFAEVVRRHQDLVFATALRKVADAGAAQEIAQNVFAALVRKAWRFAPDDSLPAWLHKAALLESKSWLRGELGRRRREQTAAELGTTMNTPEDQPAFAALVPLLDEALLSLRERDRTALLLRFYENQSLRDVGTALSAGEEAATKRVQRALEKLSEFFKRRGFKTASVAVATAALEYTATTASAAVVEAVVSTALRAAPPALTGVKALLAKLAGLTRVQRASSCGALAMLLCLFLARSCDAANRPSVTIERVGTNVAVRFTGALQRAEQPQGPFRPVPNNGSPLVVPAGAGQEFWRAWLPGVRSIAAGSRHTVALRRDGTLWTWGYNRFGGLGIGTFTTNAPYGTNTPQQVGSDTNWHAVAAGGGYTVALRTDGTLWAWGLDSSGQLGIGYWYFFPLLGKSTPQRVGTDTNWQAVAAGQSHTLALRTDGTLWAWGLNSFGQLGIGTFTNANTPQRVGTDTNWQAVAAGELHTMALRPDGTLWAWGLNDRGQCNGIFDTNAPYYGTNTPQRVGSDTNWQAVATASGHTVALRTDGTVWTWGLAGYGLIASGGWDWNDVPAGISTPRQVGTDANWQAVAAGYSHTLALRADGTLWAWGHQKDVLEGTFWATNAPYGPTPQQIGTNANWQAISTIFHAVALRADGTLWTWGGNYYGQLGNSTYDDTSTPQQVGTNTNW